MARLSLPSLLGAVALATVPVAADTPVFELHIENHRFEPALLTVPAGQRIKLVIKNLDPSPEEFEIYGSHREKIVLGNAEVAIFVGPLNPGEYPFLGEFNQETAQGKIVAE